MVRVHGTTCDLCGDAMVRPTGDPAICATCATDLERAPQ